MRETLRVLRKVFGNHFAQDDLFCKPMTDVRVFHVMEFYPGRETDEKHSRAKAVMERINQYFDLNQNGYVTTIGKGTFNVILKPQNFPCGTCINKVIFRIRVKECSLRELQRDSRLIISFSQMGLAVNVFSVGAVGPIGPIDPPPDRPYRGLDPQPHTYCGFMILDAYDGDLADKPTCSKYKATIEAQLTDLIRKTSERGVLWADMKPENILYKIKDGKCVITFTDLDSRHVLMDYKLPNATSPDCNMLFHTHMVIMACHFKQLDIPLFEKVVYNTTLNDTQFDEYHQQSDKLISTYKHYSLINSPIPNMKAIRANIESRE